MGSNGVLSGVANADGRLNGGFTERTSKSGATEEA